MTPDAENAHDTDLSRARDQDQDTISASASMAPLPSAPSAAPSPSPLIAAMPPAAVASGVSSAYFADHPPATRRALASADSAPAVVMGASQREEGALGAAEALGLRSLSDASRPLQMAQSAPPLGGSRPPRASAPGALVPSPMGARAAAAAGAGVICSGDMAEVAAKDGFHLHAASTRLQRTSSCGARGIGSSGGVAGGEQTGGDLSFAGAQAAAQAHAQQQQQYVQSAPTQQQQMQSMPTQQQHMQLTPAQQQQLMLLQESQQRRQQQQQQHLAAAASPECASGGGVHLSTADDIRALLDLQYALAQHQELLKSQQAQAHQAQVQREALQQAQLQRMLLAQQLQAAQQQAAAAAAAAAAPPTLPQQQLLMLQARQEQLMQHQLPQQCVAAAQAQAALRPQQPAYPGAQGGGGPPLPVRLWGALTLQQQQAMLLQQAAQQAQAVLQHAQQGVPLPMSSSGVMLGPSSIGQPINQLPSQALQVQLLGQHLPPITGAPPPQPALVDLSAGITLSPLSPSSTGITLSPLSPNSTMSSVMHTPQSSPAAAAAAAALLGRGAWVAVQVHAPCAADHLQGGSSAVPVDNATVTALTGELTGMGMAAAMAARLSADGDGGGPLSPAGGGAGTGRLSVPDELLFGGLVNGGRGGSGRQVGRMLSEEQMMKDELEELLCMVGGFFGWARAKMPLTGGTPAWGRWWS